MSAMSAASEPASASADGDAAPSARRCDPGRKGARELVVTDADTSSSLGSGTVEVLGTPAVLALAEGACCDAVAGGLDPDETTVGAWAEVEHVRAVPVGARVCAHAVLTGHHGRRLEFSVTLESGGETIARVRHRRILVDRARFLAGSARV
jgi:fluoroacetyl-CoA thioesterase